MKINIKATGIELTPAISDYVDKKVHSLEKHLPEDPSTLDANKDIVAQVEVGKTTKHHKSGDVFRAEIHLTGNGLDHYAVSEMDDLYAAIDTVKDEISRELIDAKGKRLSMTRRGAQMFKNVMKGITDTTAMAGRATSRGFSWGVERFRFKGFKSFKKRK